MNAIYINGSHIDYTMRTHKWIMADKERFQQIERAFLYLDFQGIPIQQGRIHAELVKSGYRLTDNDIFRNDRNLYPTLARYLRALHPELKQSVRLRKSEIDKMVLPPIPTGWAILTAENTDKWLTTEDWA
jgi:hypothetical protein